MNYKLITFLFIIFSVKNVFATPVTTEILLMRNMDQKLALNIELFNSFPDSIRNKWKQKENSINENIKNVNEEISRFGIKINLLENGNDDNYIFFKDTTIIDSNCQGLRNWYTSANSYLIQFRNKIIYNDKVITWDNFEFENKFPCLLGDSLLRVEETGTIKIIYPGCNSGINYALVKGIDTIYKFTDSMACMDSKMSLLVFKNNWYLQNRYSLIINGVNYNKKNRIKLVYNLRLVKNNALFFYEKDGKHRILYDGKNITKGYDYIYHDLCCEDSFFNIKSFKNKFSFFAIRDSILYYVVITF